MTGRIPTLLTLTYAATALAVLVGWLTAPQLAVTFALELIVALHYASHRILHSEGPVQTKGGMTWSANGKNVTTVTGQPLTPEERRTMSNAERVALSACCAMAALAVVVFSEGGLGAGPAQILTWASLTATAAWGERQRHLEWLSTDARLTADPTQQTRHPAARSIFFFLTIFVVVVAGPDTRGTALLLVVQAYLVDRHHQRRELEASRSAGSPPTLEG